MMKFSKNEFDENNPIISKIKTENSNSKDDYIDIMDKSKEMPGLNAPNQSLFSIKKDIIHLPKTSDNSLKDYFSIENILKNSKIKATNKNSLTERSFLNDEEIMKLKKKLNDLKQGNKRIFNLEKEIEEKSKSICDLKDSIRNLKNLNFKHDNKHNNSCGSNNYNRNFNYDKINNSKTSISNNIGHVYNISRLNFDNNIKSAIDKSDNNLSNDLGLASFFIEQMKMIELALEGKAYKTYKDNNISLNEEDSTYELIKEKTNSLIKKINLLHKNNLSNNLEISNELETEKNKNMELLLKIKALNKENFSLKKEIELKIDEIKQLNNKLNQNEIALKFNNSMKIQNIKEKSNNYTNEINNLNLKLKKLSFLFEKNDNLLKQITDENNDLKKKNLELENQLIIQKGSNKNNNLSNIKIKNNNSKYDPLQYIESIKKKINKIKGSNYTNQEENDDLINKLNLEKETDKLIKENYAGNIINLKNNYLNNENNRKFGDNESYLFKNKKRKQNYGKDYNKNNIKNYYNYINNNIDENLES